MDIQPEVPFHWWCLLSLGIVESPTRGSPTGSGDTTSRLSPNSRPGSQTPPPYDAYRTSEALLFDLAAAPEVTPILEGSLDAFGFVCDQLSVADFSFFPHVSSLKPLGILLEDAAYAKLLRWNRQMRMEAAVREDLEYVKRSAAEKFGSGRSPYEDEKVVWRGDRIEWLLAHGFRDWFFTELASGRAVVPCGVQAHDSSSTSKCDTR